VIQTSDADILDTRSRVSGGVERLVCERDVADGKAPLSVRHADDAILELSGVVADLRPLTVVVDDRRVVSPVSHGHVEVWRTYQFRRNDV